MKKIVLLVMLGLQLFAYEDYVGLGIGYNQFSMSTPLENVNNGGACATVNLGHKYSDYGRLHASATYVNHDDEIDSSGLISFGYDFLFPVFDDTFELYLGPVAGYTSYKETNLDLSGIHYGVELGVLLEITDSIELELGYNFLNQNKSQGAFEAKHSQSGYFQVNFFFDKKKYFKYE